MWCERLCRTIRTNCFRLQELTLEGIDGGASHHHVARCHDHRFDVVFCDLCSCGISPFRSAFIIVITDGARHAEIKVNHQLFTPLMPRSGGDALGRAIGETLSDFFVRRVGMLASISLVRCDMSDEGAKAIAQGVLDSATLTHLDLSGSTHPDERPLRRSVYDNLLTAGTQLCRNICTRKMKPSSLQHLVLSRWHNALLPVLFRRLLSCCISANVISDVGMRALALAIVGECPLQPENVDREEASRRRSQPKSGTLRTLDLGQVIVLET